jgi:UDP-N-acetylglucosamine diphosphorylase / glucose-1-phosphate thymidylyltransferase / UDP-N-acetylgalactosamine diphosphorylase / glucosamine-1-phosphate N-acetyltransferase / galactosamine-1-phosphate N-acetyltransferase
MRLLIYEDQHCTGLAPLALMRPVFELICGRESLRKRLQRWFPKLSTGVRVRPVLAEVYAEQHPKISVNDLIGAQEQTTLLVNGRWVPEFQINPDRITLDHAGFVGTELAWILLEPEELKLLCDDDFDSILLRIAGMRRTAEAGGQIMRYPWDLVARNRLQLIRDYFDLDVSNNPTFDHVQVLGDPRDVYISEAASIDPYVVLDARTGPISIEQDVQIQSFTRIEGPCHIGRGTRLFRASIRGGTTIGEHCRVGGEVEESILHAFVNKYHDGFLGHSYVCPWVNLGAMTSTSDLKNDYSIVRVPLNGELTDTGQQKVGSFIGDHTKTAIDSMFNTGSSIGVMTMVLPGGRLLPRYIPSFCNVNFGELAADCSLDSWIATAAATMERRGVTLTPADARLIRRLYDESADDRRRTLDRVSEKHTRSFHPVQT